MKRKDFIQALSISIGGFRLPVNSLLADRLIKIYDNYVAGLRYYRFDRLKSHISTGAVLQLVREKQNKYDAFAVAVYFQGEKLGYLPAYENVVLSNLLDSGVDLKAFVSQIDPTAACFNALAIAVFAPGVIPSNRLIEMIKDEGRADDANDLYRNGFKVFS